MTLLVALESPLPRQTEGHQFLLGTRLYYYKSTIHYVLTYTITEAQTHAPSIKHSRFAQPKLSTVVPLEASSKLSVNRLCLITFQSVKLLLRCWTEPYPKHDPEEHDLGVMIKHMLTCWWSLYTKAEGTVDLTTLWRDTSEKYRLDGSKCPPPSKWDVSVPDHT